MNTITMLLLSFCLLACNESTPTEQKSVQAPTVTQPVVDTTKASAQHFDFGYDLEQPSQSFDLPKDLQEISGLSLSDDPQYLCAIQDEDGVLYYINKTTGAVGKKVKFHKKGDYEGVEIVDDKIYVVKSTGTLYRVSQLDPKEVKFKKFKSFINKTYEVEGLCHDAQNQRLLLACKAKAGEGEAYKLARAIYSFDLKEKKVATQPTYLLDLAQIQDFLKTSDSVKELHRFDAFFDKKQRELPFCPSAIAIHPITGNLYILSTVNKMLILLSPEGKIVHMVKLNKKVHRQPEGITFEADGSLYISNEGKGGTPQLHRFSYQKKDKKE